MKFTIGTIVNDWNQYKEMYQSFLRAGFCQKDCQYITVNNCDSNQYDMYSGGNYILSQSTGEYVILAHQDILASFDKRYDLEQRIDELNRIDLNWAVAGNAGADLDNKWALRITDKHGRYWNEGVFPNKVKMIDGNIIIIKKDTLVAFSRDLSGYHYYGWDICLNADIRGYSSYVIDWHVVHLSDGSFDESFKDSRNKFIQKWNYAFRDRIIGAFAHDQVRLSSHGN